MVAAISSIPKELEDSAGSTARAVGSMCATSSSCCCGADREHHRNHAAAHHNQFLEPYVYLDPANTTLLPFTQSAVGQFSTNFQLIYSAILASVLPLVAVYLMFRRFFIEGVMSGAIMG